MKSLIIIMLVLLLAGLYAYLNFFPHPKNDQAVDVDSEVKTVNEEKVIVVDAQKAGTVMTIKEITMEKDGFAVVYDNNNGKLGNIIGNSRYLPKGKTLNVLFGLTRPSVRGEMLYIVIHEDSGDGIFSPTIDIPARDAEKNIIMDQLSIL